MRANPVVLRATEEHAIRIAPRLRGFDAPEVKVDPVEVLRGCLAHSSHAWTWFLEGEPACMFGATSRSVLGGVGALWLVTTDAIRSDPRTFWLGSKRAVALLQEVYPTLEAHCDARFLASVQWLQRLGFTVHEPVELLGVPFRYCVKGR